LSRFRPRANVLKKKVLVKKLVYYYYSFSAKKKLKILVKYNKKYLNHKTIDTTKNLMNIFSSHLCIFVLRSKLASSISKAKRYITKGRFNINGKINYNPGHILKEGDIIQLRRSSLPSFFKKLKPRTRPKKFKKKKFFFKFFKRKVLAQRVLSLQLINFGFKAFYKNYNTYFKHY